MPPNLPKLKRNYFIAFTVVQLSQYSILEYFCHPQNIPYPLTVISNSHFPSIPINQLPIFNLLSITMDLLILEILYK